jgi:hypothetical protein
LLKIVKVKPDTPPHELQHFLTDELYLLNADKAFYSTPQTFEPVLTDAIAKADANTTQTPVMQFKYMGGNQKRFLVLSYYPDSEYMNEAHLKALTSTLGRLGFATDDIALLNVAAYADTGWQQLQEFFGVQKVLLLGTQALPAGLPVLPLNQVTPIGDAKALFTFSFDEMMGQKENTKAFWTQMQTL